MKKTIPSRLNEFDAALDASGLYPLTAGAVNTLQMNIGGRCNLACRHCHIQAGPDRTEQMERDTMDACMDALVRERIPVVDITGGAPEMNPHYRWLVERCAATGCRVKARTNLAVLTEEGFDDLAPFLADNNVEVVASMPYYSAQTTDRQRGDGAFEKAILALRSLNEAGYGRENGALALNLVYNPCGAYLPPSQKAIEADFRRELLKRYGITFTSLFTITNMPLGRFRQFLAESKNLERYTARLRASFNPAAAANVMCRDTVSVGWDGRLYDCDFNLSLGLTIGQTLGADAPGHITRFDAERLKKRTIVTGEHCYGCTAGAGSSCTGAVT